MAVLKPSTNSKQRSHPQVFRKKSVPKNLKKIARKRLFCKITQSIFQKDGMRRVRIKMGLFQSDLVISRKKIRNQHVNLKLLQCENGTEKCQFFGKFFEGTKWVIPLIKTILHRQCFLHNSSMYNISMQLNFQKTSG